MCKSDKLLSISDFCVSHREMRLHESVRRNTVHDERKNWRRVKIKGMTSENGNHFFVIYLFLCMCVGRFFFVSVAADDAYSAKFLENDLMCINEIHPRLAYAGEWKASSSLWLFVYCFSLSLSRFFFIIHPIWICCCRVLPTARDYIIIFHLNENV